jgi:cysteine-S-conjugate beta-lyase
MTEKKRREDTLVVQAGRRREWTAGVVNVPVWRASTILFDSVADMLAANPPREGRLHYGRNGTATSGRWPRR